MLRRLLPAFLLFDDATAPTSSKSPLISFTMVLPKRPVAPTMQSLIGFIVQPIHVLCLVEPLPQIYIEELLYRFQNFWVLLVGLSCLADHELYSLFSHLSKWLPARPRRHSHYVHQCLRRQRIPCPNLNLSEFCLLHGLYRY